MRHGAESPMGTGNEDGPPILANRGWGWAPGMIPDPGKSGMGVGIDPPGAIPGPDKSGMGTGMGMWGSAPCHKGQSESEKKNEGAQMSSELRLESDRLGAWPLLRSTFAF